MDKKMGAKDNIFVCTIKGMTLKRRQRETYRSVEKKKRTNELFVCDGSGGSSGLATTATR